MKLGEAFSVLALLHRVDAGLGELVAIQKERLEVERERLRQGELQWKLECLRSQTTAEEVERWFAELDGTGIRGYEAGEGEVMQQTQAEVALLHEMKAEAIRLGLKVDDETDIEAIFAGKAIDEL